MATRTRGTQGVNINADKPAARRKTLRSENSAGGSYSDASDSESSLISDASHRSTRSKSRAQSLLPVAQAKPVEEHKSDEESDASTTSSRRLTRRSSSKSILAEEEDNNGSKVTRRASSTTQLDKPLSRRNSAAKLSEGTEQEKPRRSRESISITTTTATITATAISTSSSSSRLRLQDELKLPEEYFSGLLKTPAAARLDSEDTHNSNTKKPAGPVKRIVDRIERLNYADELSSLCGAATTLYSSHVATRVANINTYLTPEYLGLSLFFALTYLISALSHSQTLFSALKAQYNPYWEQIRLYVANLPAVPSNLFQLPANSPVYSRLHYLLVLPLLIWALSWFFARVLAQFRHSRLVSCENSYQRRSCVYNAAENYTATATRAVFGLVTVLTALDWAAFGLFFPEINAEIGQLHWFAAFAVVVAYFTALELAFFSSSNTLPAKVQQLLTLAAAVAVLFWAETLQNPLTGQIATVFSSKAAVLSAETLVKYINLGFYSFLFVSLLDVAKNFAKISNLTSVKAAEFFTAVYGLSIFTVLPAFLYNLILKTPFFNVKQRLFTELPGDKGQSLQIPHKATENDEFQVYFGVFSSLLLVLLSLLDFFVAKRRANQALNAN
jgi:hypothetical protein